jgi:hypothetical protein
VHGVASEHERGDQHDPTKDDIPKQRSKVLARPEFSRRGDDDLLVIGHKASSKGHDHQQESLEPNNALNPGRPDCSADHKRPRYKGRGACATNPTVFEARRWPLRLGVAARRVSASAKGVRGASAMAWTELAVTMAARPDAGT